jgi:two-component system sensor histidine kinase BaeS
MPSTPPDHDPPSVDQTRRSELLERAVHDLKNPLAVVRASLEWLEVELVDREDALDAVRDAGTAAARLLAIVEDLSALAQLEGGRRVTHDPIDVDTMLNLVTATTSARHAARRMTLAVTAPPGLIVRGDGNLVVRLFEVLVDVSMRGAPLGACVEVMLHRPDEDPSTIEIEVGLKGTVAKGPPTPTLDSLANGGLGIYVAFQVALAHGGSLLIVPTATNPRVRVRLPM